VSWEQLRNYLERIAESDLAVRVSVGRSADEPLFEARGKLSRVVAEHDGTARFAINTYPSREDGGDITLRPHEFRDARLWTFDGDDYFHLAVQMGHIMLFLQDTNSF